MQQMSGLWPARNGGDASVRESFRCGQYIAGRLVACGIQFPIFQWNGAE
jgi:hypothetical protein